jgi:hypothetical protein
MNQMSKDPEALLDIVARLDEVIEELKGSRQDFCAQLVGMARLELMMTVYRISEHEVGALRSLIDPAERSDSHATPFAVCRG